MVSGIDPNPGDFYRLIVPPSARSDILSNRPRINLTVNVIRRIREECASRSPIDILSVNEQHQL